MARPSPETLAPPKALTPLEVEHRCRDLAEQGAWAALCDLALASHSPRTRPRTLLYLTFAAVETGSEAAMGVVLDRAMEGSLPPHIRCEMARRLAAGGQGWAAWAVLMADPALTGTEEGRGRAVKVLRQILGATGDAQLRRCAQAMLRKWEEPLAQRSAAAAPFRFPAGALSPEARERRHPLELARGKGVPLSVLEELRALDAAFEGMIARASPPAVRQFENVFVNRAGQIWDRDGLLLDSRNRPLPPESGAAQADAPSIEAGIMAMDVAGFYHWFAEWLPSLFWSFAPEAPRLPYLLPEDAPASHRDTIALAAGRQPDLRAVGDALHVRRLYVAGRSLAGFAHWAAYAGGFRRMAEAARRAEPDLAGVERLYISRRDADRRPLVNEAELEEALVRHGFQPVCFSGISAAGQIALVQNASVVVAPHGAGLVHLLGDRSGLSVYEMMPVLSGAMSLRFNFARISRLRGHRHRVRLEQANPMTHRWSVNLPEVVEEIARFADAHSRPMAEMAGGF